MKNPLVVVNPNATYYEYVGRQILQESVPAMVSNNSIHARQQYELAFSRGIKHFIVSGGDGTINNFLQFYMNIPKERRQDVVLGIIPAGRANDLAEALGIPKDPLTALEVARRGNVTSIDVASVNNKYFVTGGGIGLPATIVDDVSGNSGLVNRCLGNLVYSFSAAKQVLKGIEPIHVLRTEKINLYGVMAAFVMNQGFIGKRFHLSPDSENDDGKLEQIIVTLPDSRVETAKKLIDTTKGELKPELAQRFDYDLWRIGNRQDFMADGEILCYDNNFQLGIVHKALKVMH